MKPLRQYAKVSWNAVDIQSVAINWSIKECEEFLKRNERVIQDRMVAQGWDILSWLIPFSATHKYNKKY